MGEQSLQEPCGLPRLAVWLHPRGQQASRAAVLGDLSRVVQRLKLVNCLRCHCLVGSPCLGPNKDDNLHDVLEYI